MDIRKTLEKREEELLMPLAALSSRSKGRKSTKNPARTEPSFREIATA